MYGEASNQHSCAPPHSPSRVDTMHSVEQRDTKMRAKGNLEEIYEMTGLCADTGGNKNG